MDHVGERAITTQSSTRGRCINEVSAIIIFNLSHVVGYAFCLSLVPCQLGDRICFLTSVLSKELVPMPKLSRE
jgi:hypothetical protein